YEGGKMLFLGLGTGLGSAMIVDGIVEPMELGHLPYKRRTFEDYVGVRGYERLGKKKWRQHVAGGVARLMAALAPGYVTLGGGNVKKLEELPPDCRAGNNANAFLGGFRLWEEEGMTGQTKITAESLLRTARPAWKALTVHHQQVRVLPLRQLFADDPTRGER